MTYRERGYTFKVVLALQRGVSKSLCCCSLNLSPVLMNTKAVKTPNAVVYKNCNPATEQHKERKIDALKALIQM